MVVNRITTMGGRAGGGAKAPNGGTVGRGGYSGYTKAPFPGAAKVSQLQVGTKVKSSNNGLVGTVTKIEKYGSTRWGVQMDFGGQKFWNDTRPNRYLNGTIVK